MDWLRAMIAAAVAMGFLASVGSASAANDAPRRACLTKAQQRAAVGSGHAVRLVTAIRALRHRVPGAVIKARLCRNGKGLVYVLTVLAHDGKVTHASVDAASGRLIGR